MEMEIKALLVDDEEQCVKTLQDGIDWKVLGVAETFVAYNAVQAREIMKEESWMTVDSTMTAVQEVPVDAMEEAEVHREEVAVEMVCG